MFLLMKKLIILNNNSNSEETFTTENGRVFSNPPILGVLPWEVFPEINPVYDSDISDEVRLRKKKLS